MTRHRVRHLPVRSALRTTHQLLSALAARLQCELFCTRSWPACGRQRNSIHCSQGFHDREITHPKDADPRIVQVDNHPQSGCKNDFVNGVEHRKSAANTTIAEAYYTNPDCRRPHKHRHDWNGQMSSRHRKVRRMQIDDLVDRRQNYRHQWRIVFSSIDRRPPHFSVQAPYLREQGLDLVASFTAEQFDPVGVVLL